VAKLWVEDIKENLDFEESLGESDGKFLDEDFPPEDVSLYVNGKGPGPGTDMVHPALWKRAQSCYDNPILMVGGAECADIEQGYLGTCYLLGSIAALSTKPGLIKDLFITYSIQHGIFAVRFSRNGRWTFWIVDDYLPCVLSKRPETMNKPVPAYATSKDDGELYVSFIEKAYAKMHGSYEAVDGGLARYALVAMTGGTCMQIDLQSDRVKAEAASGAFWDFLLAEKQKGKLMSCQKVDTEQAFEGHATDGLLFNHAYSIIDLQNVDHVKLLRIHNPHGEAGWNGRWSSVVSDNPGEF
jgi:calpain-type cysteine protease DEK1